MNSVSICDGTGIIEVIFAMPATRGSLLPWMKYAICFAIASVSLAPAAHCQSSHYVQAGPLYFTAPAGGPNPLTQAFTVSSNDGSQIYTHASVTTSSGGNWLSGGCNGCYTPFVNLISVDATTLTQGVYTGQIAFSSDGGDLMTVNVTLSVVAVGEPYPLSSSGGLTFTAGNGFDAAPQTIPIVNGGSGALNWTAIASNVGSSNWLIMSTTSGTAPANLTVSASTQGLTTGFYYGQVVVQTANGGFTVPVSLRIVDGGTATYQQVPNLSFTGPAGGPNPLAQVFTVSSTTASQIYTYAYTTTSSGGNWLTGGCNGCYTPFVNLISVDATTLAPGIYTGEIVFTSKAGDLLSVGVTFTVEGVGVPYPVAGSGGLTFTAGNGFNAAPQTIAIVNGGSGTLNWSASASTFHNSLAAGTPNWLTLSTTSGTAPANLMVSVSMQGLTTGFYYGQVVVQTTNGSFTVPVSLRIVDGGTATDQQVPNLSFTGPAGGPNPLAQAFTVSSTTASQIYTYAYTTTSSGGNWLTGGCNGCYTPFVNLISVDATTLAPGIYTGEIVFTSKAGDLLSVGVTFTVEGVGVPYPVAGSGGLTFTAGNGFNAAPQTIAIVNGGSGTLNWSASASTFHNSLAAGTPNW